MRTETLRQGRETEMKRQRAGQKMERFREAVNPEGSAIQTNIYSANRIRRGRGWTDARQLLFKCMCGAAQYEENEMKTIYVYLRTPPPI